MKRVNREKLHERCDQAGGRLISALRKSQREEYRLGYLLALADITDALGQAGGVTTAAYAAVRKVEADFHARMRRTEDA